MSPTLLPENSVNQRCPSMPATIPNGAELVVGIANSLKWPSVVTRPILLPASSASGLSRGRPP
jgi:hypothetical protein